MEESEKLQNLISEVVDGMEKISRSINEASDTVEKISESLEDEENAQRHVFADIESSRIKFYDMAMTAIENNDYKTACDFLIRSSEPQNSKDMYNWGVMFFKGIGVRKDIGRAIEWYEKAAENGYIHAYLVLGALYYMGESVPENVPLAIELFKKASDSGDEQSKKVLEAILSSNEKITINLL